MTEAEAVAKWCPFVRAPSTAVNRMPAGSQHPAAHCLASKCMAWRAPDERGGYCGLAGTPSPNMPPSDKEQDQ